MWLQPYMFKILGNITTYYVFTSFNLFKVS